ncbi:DUF2046 domain containing protein [Nitzschia inconspicua]|uniref:DUF2046 domain containing protein n=1 Tax=Nitzschia inconspicua TaxID=303405 RepID=A0A9K3LJG7_9STRA|nr:DUF2046 domain containing protein [Nitzschia inconspicua]
MTTTENTVLPATSNVTPVSSNNNNNNNNSTDISSVELPPHFSPSTPPRGLPAMNHPGSPRLGNPPTRPLGYPISPTFSNVPSRSISLSPTHLMGRRRAGPSSFLLSGPNMPFLSQPQSEMPVRFSEHQKAMEEAVASERQRAKNMEAQEKDLSADELRQILRQERHRMAGFARTIAELRSTAVQCQSQAEIHEEGRINSLLTRLETMQLEKGRIVNELEREEEMLTNTLQKKLDQVQREKAQLEKLIEHEQLSHSKLQSKLTGMRKSVGTIGDGPTGLLPSTSLEAWTENEDEEEDGDLDAVLPDLAAQNTEF